MTLPDTLRHPHPFVRRAHASLNTDPAGLAAHPLVAGDRSLPVASSHTIVIHVSTVPSQYLETFA